MSANLQHQARRVWKAVAPQALRHEVGKVLQTWRLRRRQWAARARPLSPAARAAPAGPIKVVGLFGASHGIGASARLTLDALQALGAPVEAIDVSDGAYAPFAGPQHASAWIFVLNPPELVEVLTRLGPQFVVGPRYGYWAWELPRAPADWRFAGVMVHEIWAPSQYTARSLAHARAPVRVVPHPLTRFADASALEPPRSDVFRALAFLDFNSSAARKNPFGAIAAFRAAFGDDSGARLIIKAQGGERYPQHLAALKSAAAGNVEILHAALEEEAVQQLIRDVDVVISLHRAEGFGLVMAEAMAARTPVIATAYSGNLEFMTAESAILIPAGKIPVDDPQGIYIGQTWADPDLKAAASALRVLRADPAFRAALAEQGWKQVKARLSPLAWCEHLPASMQASARQPQRGTTSKRLGR